MIALIEVAYVNCEYMMMMMMMMSYCFQRVLAIAILSVCLSVTRVDQSKTVQARITKSSPSAAWHELTTEWLDIDYSLRTRTTIGFRASREH